MTGAWAGLARLAWRSRKALAVAAVLILGVCLIWRAGHDSAIRVADRQNQTAKDAADETGFDWDRCTDTDSMYWDFAAHRCRRDRPGPW